MSWMGKILGATGTPSPWSGISVVNSSAAKAASQAGMGNAAQNQAYQQGLNNYNYNAGASTPGFISGGQIAAAVGAQAPQPLTKASQFDRCFDTLQSLERQMRAAKSTPEQWKHFNKLRDYFLDDPDCPEILHGMADRLTTSFAGTDTKNTGPAVMNAHVEIYCYVSLALKDQA